MVAPKNTDENVTGVGIVDGEKVNILRLLEHADKVLCVTKDNSGHTVIRQENSELTELFKTLTNPLIDAAVDLNKQAFKDSIKDAVVKLNDKLPDENKVNDLPNASEMKIAISLDDQVSSVAKLFSDLDGDAAAKNEKRYSRFIVAKAKELSKSAFGVIPFRMYMNGLVSKLVSEVNKSGKTVADYQEQFDKIKDHAKSMSIDLNNIDGLSPQSEISEKSMHSELWRNYRLLHHQGSNDEHVKLAKKKAEGLLKGLGTTTTYQDVVDHNMQTAQLCIKQKATELIKQKLSNKQESSTQKSRTKTVVRLIADLQEERASREKVSLENVVNTIANWAQSTVGVKQLDITGNSKNSQDLSDLLNSEHNKVFRVTKFGQQVSNHAGSVVKRLISLRKNVRNEKQESVDRVDDCKNQASSKNSDPGPVNKRQKKM